ncbi:TetR/AcrR family transcriptional regulator [Nocardioides marmotae]|uniref:TetR/AcrR family transcriptional regulator n=1 Tax=Nocardioides marmotae TaxID=2663857 RepID=UPI0012B59C47|nr:TetR/AcrR family transcriptional regulator [Nocardioides marmotae]MBC9735198.1 TetR/AcrR family transcriptional regulator [Nocardioides marmotae]MTB86298.1 TetR family transcriptional regulator [Nocardioides marmotae]
MARKTTRQHSQGEASRRTILDATLQIAGERGYVGTTMAKVTKASGLPASSVYWHFRNKDELLADALDHGYRRFADEQSLWLDHDPEAPLEDRVLRELRGTTRALDEDPDFWRMGLLLALETGPAVGSGPRERFLDVRERAIARLVSWWHAQLGATASTAAHAHTLALLTVASTDGLFLAHQSDVQEDLGPLVQALARGLAAAARHLVADEPAPRRTGRRVPPVRLVVADPDSGREKLLRAAADVAAASGYDGAGIARICEQAGLPASSLYWHFKDKDDLLASAIEHSYQEWYVAQPAWLPPDPGTRWQDELRDHFAVSLRSLAERPLFLRLGHLLLLLRREQPPAARARFVGVRRQARLVQEQWFAQVLGPDALPGTADALGLLTMALSDGLFFSNQLDEPTWDVGVFTELLVTMLDAASSVPASEVGAS